MMTALANDLKGRLFRLVAQSGSFVSAGSGMAPSEEGPIPVLLGTAMGAFGGMIFGFIISKILRFAASLTGRYLGGYRWVFYGAILGALLCGWLAASADRS
jgi:hypothetical protein